MKPNSLGHSVNVKVNLNWKLWSKKYVVEFNIMANIRIIVILKLNLFEIAANTIILGNETFLSKFGTKSWLIITKIGSQPSSNNLIVLEKYFYPVANNVLFSMIKKSNDNLWLKNGIYCSWRQKYLNRMMHFIVKNNVSDGKFQWNFWRSTNCKL